MNHHYTFGSEEKNELSLQNWIAWLQDQIVKNNSACIQAELQRKLRLPKIIDCYVQDEDKKNYPLYLEGIWRQVAYFDETTRLQLVEIYKGNHELSFIIKGTPEKITYTTSHHVSLGFDYTQSE